MRYLVVARVKPGKEIELLRAIDDGSLGAGSIAGTEYLRNMENARVYNDGRIKWVEICFCDPPLAEERPYWESFFDLVRVQDALNQFEHQTVGRVPDSDLVPRPDGTKVDAI
jgi:hypothetical protein